MHVVQNDAAVLKSREYERETGGTAGRFIDRAPGGERREDRGRKGVGGAPTRRGTKVARYCRRLDGPREVAVCHTG